MIFCLLYAHELFCTMACYILLGLYFMQSFISIASIYLIMPAFGMPLHGPFYPLNVVQIGQSSYRGGGRRGGRPFRGGGRSFRGGGRGQFGPHGFGPDGSGRGQGGGRYFPPHNAASTPNLGSVPTAEGPGALIPGEASQLQGKTPQAFMQPLSGSDPGQAQFPAMAQHGNPFWRSPCMAWCELCRVDCNTLEILEQHKNGKRHKKNLLVYQELQNLNKLITGVQNEQMPISDFKPQLIQSERVGGSEDKQPSQGTGANGTEKEQQTEAEKSEVSAQPTEEQERKARMDHFQAPGRGLKRKMRGGRGGKRMRQFEPPKPKEMIPLICELCNVKCESQVVFDSHLAGKKHHSNLKRFHGYQAIIAGALQALIPSNPNAPSNFFIPQVHQQGVSGSQGLPAQPMPYMQQGQAPGMAPGPASEPEPAPVSALETQDKEGTKTVESQATSEAGGQNTVTAEANSQLQPVMIASEASSGVSTNTTIVSETSAFEGKDVIPPIDDPDVAPSENKVKGAEQVLSTTPADKAVAVPE